MEKNKPTDPDAMRMYAELMKSVMPEGYGFTLLVFENREDGAQVSYISSAERESMKGTMQTMLDKWNRGGDFLEPNLN